MINNTNNLPEGWVWTTIGEVAQLVRGVSYDKSAATEVAKDDYVPILRATNIQDDGLILDAELVYVPDDYVKEEQMLQAGDVVICMSSGSKHLVGKAAQLTYDWRGSFGTFCAAARFRRDVNAKYAGYFFGSPSYRSLIRQKSSGVNINNLRHRDVEEISIPLAPLPEQQRIVTEIEKQFTRLEAGVAALRRAQANLKRYKAAVLKAACEGKLVEQDPSDEPAAELLKRILAERRAKWEADLRAKGKDPRKAKYDEPKPPDIDALPELPRGWCWANIDQLISMLQYGTSVKADAEAETGVPVIRMGNIQEGRLDFSDLKFIDPSKEDIPKYTLTEGDILINRTNSAELVGKAGLFARSGIFVFASYLIRLRVDSDFVLPQYLVTCINSEIGRRHVVKVKHQVAGQANINSQDIRMMPIPLPPLAEQRRIVAEVERRLSVVQELEGTLTANLARAERLRQAILQRAFEGRLVDR